MKNKNNDVRSGRHCVFLMHVHLVFVTKYRKCVFTKEQFLFMQKIIEQVCLDFDAELKEFNAEENHVHILINYPPKVAISKMVNSLKGVSSRLLKKQFPELNKYFWNGALWSPSYFAGSVGGAPLDVLKEYIENQNTPE